jgi:hypothetical protein
VRSSADNAADQRNKPKEPTMHASSTSVRLAGAALAAFIGAVLVLGKAHFSEEYHRLAVRGDVVVLPVAEVIGERASTRLASTPVASRAN